MEKVVVWFDKYVEDISLDQLIVITEFEIPIAHCVDKMRESVSCLVVKSIFSPNLVENSVKDCEKLSPYADFSLDTTAI